MKKLLTLLLIYKNDQILLGLKKRGFGMGKWNGFGGKVDKSESIEDATKRELFEESGLVVNSMEKIGLTEFVWQGKEGDVWEVHIFASNDFVGTPEETEEMKPQWFDNDKIPFEKMWPDDKFWFPLFLTGKKFEGRFLYDDKNDIVEKELREVRNLS